MGSVGRVGLRFGRRLWRRGMPVLLPAVLLLSWAAPWASAANRIYWGDCGISTSSTVSFANLNDTGHGGDLKTGGVTPSCPVGIAMDLLGGKIYWGDGGDGISFAKLNDTGGGGHLNTNGATTPSSLQGVATDPAAGKIYWADFPSGPLSFAKLNNKGGGHDLQTSGATPPGDFLGIAIDPATGKIYWANGGANKISFANLDGTGHGGDLNTHGATVNNPFGLAIDPANGKIYWANNDDNTHPISFANVNDTGHGGDLKVAGVSANGAVGVAIDPEGGKIYWANEVGNTISFAKLNNSGGGGKLKTKGATPPSGPQFLALLRVPLATAKPRVSGGSKVGSKLSCSRGKWARDLVGSFLYQRPVSLSYSWSRNGKRISGATKNSIITSRAGTYTCTVTAKNQAGSTKKTGTSHKVTT